MQKTQNGGLFITEWEVRKWNKTSVNMHITMYERCAQQLYTAPKTAQELKKRESINEKERVKKRTKAGQQRESSQRRAHSSIPELLQQRKRESMLVGSGQKIKQTQQQHQKTSKNITENKKE